MTPSVGVVEDAQVHYLVAEPVDILLRVALGDAYEDIEAGAYLAVADSSYDYGGPACSLYYSSHQPRI